MASLTIKELRKRNNFSKFLTRIQNGIEFSLISSKKEEMKKESVVITPEASLLEGLQQAVLNPEVDLSLVLPKYSFNNILLLPVDNALIPSGYLQKTIDFGGQSTEQVYQQEGKEHYNLNAALRKLTIFGVAPINLIIKTSNNQVFSFENVIKVQPAKKINGNAGKTDFEFLDKQDNVILRVSHKHGSRARHFRQWSGVKEFSDHPEVVQFGVDVKAQVGEANLFPTALSIGRDILDEELKKKAIFGDDVDFLIQGSCVFQRTDEAFTYILNANLILGRNEPIDILPKDYHPILLARRGDLSRNSWGIKACRGVIYPAAGRHIHMHI